MKLEEKCNAPKLLQLRPQLELEGGVGWDLHPTFPFFSFKPAVIEKSLYSFPQTIQALIITVLWQLGIQSNYFRKEFGKVIGEKITDCLQTKQTPIL